MRAAVSTCGRDRPEKLKKRKRKNDSKVLHGSKDRDFQAQVMGSRLPRGPMLSMRGELDMFRRSWHCQRQAPPLQHVFERVQGGAHPLLAKGRPRLG